MTVFQISMNVLLGLLSISMVLSAARLLLGPTIPDRAMALDAIMLHVAAIIALYVIAVGETILLDAILVVAVLAFLATVALARYIEEGRN